MTNTEFKALLKQVFNEHFVMKGRDHHTVNELLHVLRYEENMQSLQGVNISVEKLDGRCCCIPCLDAFVDLKNLGVWFNDDSIEFETDEFEDDGELKRFDNITVYEREAK